MKKTLSNYQRGIIMQNQILKTKGLSKTFAGQGEAQNILENLDLEIYEKDFTVIMGPSGAGKSTLLYALSGMDKPTSGRIYFDDKEISKYSEDKLAVFRRKNCGFVFQQVFLMDNMSLMDNALASGRLLVNNKKELAASAKNLFNQVGISEKIWRKFPNQISGGEAQRAGIVRSLINNPKVVFADEPTGALHSAAGLAVLDVLTDINRSGQSIVMVTHDLNSACRGNRILYLRDGAICGELKLGFYECDNAERRETLRTFLAGMGW